MFFSVVANEGITRLQGLSDAAGPLPPGVRFSEEFPTFVDIRTSATFGGPVQGCVRYADVDGDDFEDTTGIDVDLIRVLHRQSVGGAFVDATLGLDRGNRLACAQVTSLSPFVLGTEGCESSVDCDDADECTTNGCVSGSCVFTPDVENPQCVPTTTTTSATSTTTSSTTTTTSSTTTTTVVLPTTTTTAPKHDARARRSAVTSIRTGSG